jgi:tetratricopeptide (TPR) repeat protein
MATYTREKFSATGIQSKKIFTNTLLQFRKVTASLTYFKLGFFTFIVLQTVSFFIALSFFVKTAMLAVLLGGILLTGFMYFILLFYFQAKKPEQVLILRERFIQSCRRSLTIPRGEVEHHLSVSQSLLKLVSCFNDFEYRYFTPPRFLRIFDKMLQKIGSFFHKDDVYKFKEMLMHSAICEHIEQIRFTPIDLEVHASLANAYVLLSKFYMDQLESKTNKTEKLKGKFSLASTRAIEELQILNDYAPNDPWVHVQLAQSYRMMQMKEEEAKEYEIILQLSPNDHEVLYHLGVLYFELNQNAKGLRVYEELKKTAAKRAQDLLKYYGSSQSIELLMESI